MVVVGILTEYQLASMRLGTGQQVNGIRLPTRGGVSEEARVVPAGQLGTTHKTYPI